MKDMFCSNFKLSQKIGTLTTKLLNTFNGLLTHLAFRGRQLPVPRAPS